MVRIKYKAEFSFYNLLTDTQAEVVKLQMLAKTVMASSVFGTWLASDSNHAIWVGGAGVILDILLGCLYFEKVEVK